MSDAEKEWRDDGDRLCAVAAARRVCGSETARRLTHDFGGTRMFFPRTVSAGHRLAVSLGQEAAQKLCDELYGCMIDIPAGESGVISMRRRIVKWGFFAGLSAAKLAPIAQCTERQVYNIIRKLRQDGELPASRLPPPPTRDHPPVKPKIGFA